MGKYTQIKEDNLKLNIEERRAGRLHLRSKPVHIWLESSSRCNLDCIICGVRTFNPQKGRDLGADVFQRVKEELFPYLKIVELQGDGEPLMAKNLDNIIDALEEYEIIPFLVTNGVLLTAKLAKRLLMMRGKIWVSLDGADARTYEHIRPRAKYNRVTENLRSAASIKRSLNNGSEVGIIFVPTSTNFEQLPTLIEQAKEWGIGSVVVNELHLDGIPARYRYLAISKQRDNLHEAFKRAAVRAEKYGIRLILPAQSIDKAQDESDLKTIDHNPPGSRFPLKCYSPWDQAFIDSSGNVRPCCAYPDSMGNILTDDFDSIWNSPHYRRIRKAINTESPPYYCRICVTWWGINAGDPATVMARSKVAYRLITRAARYIPNRRRIKKLLSKLKFKG